MARLDLTRTFDGISSVSIDLIQSQIPVRALTVHASLDEHFTLLSTLQLYNYTSIEISTTIAEV